MTNTTARVVSRRLLIMSLSVLLLGAGCGEEQARIPRPRAYPRIDFPGRNYIEFKEQECPLTFRYPDYMKVIPRTDTLGSKPASPCWFDLYAQSLGATIYCSYAPIHSSSDFDALKSDAYKIADRINQKANYMDEIRVANAQGVTGVLMEFRGSAASPLHFYLTDSTANFFRASLYFRSKVVPDSLAPVTEFIKEDLAVMINSLTFQ